MKKFKKYLSVVLACTIAVSAAVVSSSAVDNDDIDTYGSGLEKKVTQRTIFRTAVLKNLR